MADDYAYDYRFVCACGSELETDNLTVFENFQSIHTQCKKPENEALTLLARLVTAAETIVAHSHGRYVNKKS